VSTCVRFPEGLNLYCKQRSCYDVLELEETATSTEIKKAYRRMSLKYHPDKSDAEDAQTVFMSIATAYEVLSDEKLVFCTRLSSMRNKYRLEFQNKMQTDSFPNWSAKTSTRLVQEDSETRFS
jgi:hypothetical protein